MIEIQMIMFLMLTSLVSFIEKALAINQDSLKEAKIQLYRAIKDAEASQGPHQPGSGWTKQHLQSVINILEGKQVPDYKMNDAAPIEGEKRVIPLLSGSHER
jgi:hypothetical protein